MGVSSVVWGDSEGASLSFFSGFDDGGFAGGGAEDMVDDEQDATNVKRTAFWNDAYSPL